MKIHCFINRFLYLEFSRLCLIWHTGLNIYLPSWWPAEGDPLPSKEKYLGYCAKLHLLVWSSGECGVTVVPDRFPCMVKIDLSEIVFKMILSYVNTFFLKMLPV